MRYQGLVVPIPSDLVLLSGEHAENTVGKYCFVEAYAYYRSWAWSDEPECMCRVMAAFFRGWNDTLAEADRVPVLRRYLTVEMPKVSVAAEQKRCWLVLDWLLREATPAWLELGGLREHAAALRTHPVLDKQALKRIGPKLADARDAALAAAGDAARDAAWAAAGDAARAALRPTVLVLQESAHELVHRMLEVA